MKAWRKHNSTKFVRNNPNMKIKPQERATFFSSEQAGVSKLLSELLQRIGIAMPHVE